MRSFWIFIYSRNDGFSLPIGDWPLLKKSHPLLPCYAVKQTAERGNCTRTCTSQLATALPEVLSKMKCTSPRVKMFKVRESGSLAMRDAYEDESQIWKQSQLQRLKLFLGWLVHLQNLLLFSTRLSVSEDHKKTDIWGELDIQCRPYLRWPCEYPLDSSLLSLDRCRVLFCCRYHYHSRFVFDEGGYKWNRNQMTKCRFSKAIGCKATMGIWSSWWLEVPSNCLTSGGMTLLELNSLHKAMH